MVDNVVCITVYYKMFSVSTKKSVFSKKENLVVRGGTQKNEIFSIAIDLFKKLQKIH